MSTRGATSSVGSFRQALSAMPPALAPADQVPGRVDHAILGRPHRCGGMSDMTVPSG